MALINSPKRSNPNFSLTNTIVNITSDKRKNNKGCSGCLFSMIGICLVICLIFVGLFSYVYLMDKDEALGALAIKILKNQSINISLNADINKNQSIPFDEKVALNISYDKFLSDYDTMPPEKQKKLKKKFGVLIKKFLYNPSFLQTGTPPSELMEIVTLIMPDQKTIGIQEEQDAIEETIWLELSAQKDKVIPANSKGKKLRSNRRLN